MNDNDLIIEGMIEEARSRVIPRMKYISQVMQKSLSIGSSRIWRMTLKNKEGIYCEKCCLKQTFGLINKKKSYNITNTVTSSVTDDTKKSLS